MARMKERNESHLVSDVEPDPRQEKLPAVDVDAASTGPGEAPPVESKPLTQDELRAEFAKVTEADVAVKAHETKLEILKAERSNALKSFVGLVGNKGPWEIAGQRVAVTERGGRFNLTRESAVKAAF